MSRDEATPDPAAPLGARVPIRLAGRRAIGPVVVGVLRAARDEQLGLPEAELHLQQRGRPGRRVAVRAGQVIPVGSARFRVEEIHPFNGRDPAGVVLSEIEIGTVSDRLG